MSRVFWVSRTYTSLWLLFIVLYYFFVIDSCYCQILFRCTIQCAIIINGLLNNKAQKTPTAKKKVDILIIIEILRYILWHHITFAAEKRLNSYLGTHWVTKTQWLSEWMNDVIPNLFVIVNFTFLVVLHSRYTYVILSSAFFIFVSFNLQVYWFLNYNVFFFFYKCFKEFLLAIRRINRIIKFSRKYFSFKIENRKKNERTMAKQEKNTQVFCVKYNHFCFPVNCINQLFILNLSAKWKICNWIITNFDRKRFSFAHLIVFQFDLK